MHGKHILSVAKNAELGYTKMINRSNDRNEETTVKTHDFWYESSGCSMKTSDFWYESDLSGFLVVDNYS